MKNLLSGSIDNEILDLIKDSLARLAMEIDAGKVFYCLKSPDDGFDYHWFFDAKTKQLERFDKGITVEVVEAYDNENYLCEHRNMLLIIKKRMIGAEVIH